MDLSKNNPSYHEMHMESKNLDLDLFFASNDQQVNFDINTLMESTPNKHVVFGGVTIEKSENLRELIKSQDFAHLKNFDFNRHISIILNQTDIQDSLKFMIQNGIMVHHHEQYLFNAWVGQLLQQFHKFITHFSKTGFEQRVVSWLLQNSHNNVILRAVLDWYKYMECRGYDTNSGYLYSYGEQFRGELRLDLIKNKGAHSVFAISCLYSMAQTPNDIGILHYDEIKDAFSGVEFSIGHKYLLSLMMHSENATNYINIDSDLIKTCDANDQFTYSDRGVVFFENQYPYGEYNPTSNNYDQHPPKKANVLFYDEEDQYQTNMQILSNVWVNVFAKFCDSAKFADPLAYIHKLEGYNISGLNALKNMIKLVEISSAYSHSLTYDYEAISFRKSVNMDFELLKESIALIRRVQMQIS